MKIPALIIHLLFASILLMFSPLINSVPTNNYPTTKPVILDKVDTLFAQPV